MGASQNTSRTPTKTERCSIARLEYYRVYFWGLSGASTSASYNLVYGTPTTNTTYFRPPYILLQEAYRFSTGKKVKPILQVQAIVKGYVCLDTVVSWFSHNNDFIAVFFLYNQRVKHKSQGSQTLSFGLRIESSDIYIISKHRIIYIENPILSSIVRIQDSRCVFRYDTINRYSC